MSQTLMSPPLSRREAEVARLAALRLTDKEIASHLYVSVRTVESHLASTYRKLGVNSRRQLAPVMGVPVGTFAA